MRQSPPPDAIRRASIRGEGAPRRPAPPQTAGDRDRLASREVDNIQRLAATQVGPPIEVASSFPDITISGLNSGG